MQRSGDARVAVRNGEHWSRQSRQTAHRPGIGNLNGGDGSASDSLGAYARGMPPRELAGEATQSRPGVKQHPSADAVDLQLDQQSITLHAKGQDLVVKEIRAGVVIVLQIVARERDNV